MSLNGFWQESYLTFEQIEVDFPWVDHSKHLGLQTSYFLTVETESPTAGV